MTFSIVDFDRLLAAYDAKPTMIVIHPDNAAMLAGMQEHIRRWYVGFYNARHPNRKISWRRMSRPLMQEAGRYALSYYKEWTSLNVFQFENFEDVEVTDHPPFPLFVFDDTLTGGQDVR